MPRTQNPYSQHREEKGGNHGLSIKFHSIYFRFPAAFAVARKTPVLYSRSAVLLDNKEPHVSKEKSNTQWTPHSFSSSLGCMLLPDLLFSLIFSMYGQRINRASRIIITKEIIKSHPFQDARCLPRCLQQGSREIPTRQMPLPMVLTLVCANEPDPRLQL